MGPIADAVVRDHGDRVRKLNRRERVVALTDARGDGITEIPLAVLVAIVLAGEALALPLARWQHAGQLAFDVDTGFLPETEARHEARGVIDIGIVREQIVVGVAGHDDRLVHVDAAVAARLVVAKPVRLSRYLEEAGIENRLRRGALAQRERVEREERLDRRAGRIRAAQRSVEQRLVDRFVQLLPVGWIDTVDEKVRIVAGLR